jgi:hypothetical protein
MRERPILLSGPLVRAILEGRKTQTRRPVKADGIADAVTGHFYPSIGLAQFRRADGRDSLPLRCPYGVPGDQLWVRETWHTDQPDLEAARAQHEDVMSASPIYYRESEVVRQNPHAGWRWRPSIHMPRWVSRINLEVTEVRVERLQAITEEDAKAEGLACDPTMPEGTDKRPTNRTRRGSFALLWDSIYAAAPWHQSPWVWVVSFRRLP